MQYWLEHFGIAVSAISGALAGRGKQVDLFGVIVLALVTAFGGGTVRDLIIGDVPVFWICNPDALINASLTGLATFFFVRYYEPPSKFLLVADAFALAFFTIAGARKAIGFELAPGAVVAIGVITGVAGGIVRDILTGEIPLVFRAGIYLYATAALIGASAFVLLERWHPRAEVNVAACVTGILLLRLIAIRWKLVLPSYDVKSRSNS
ncbi:MAG TPA: trimeric intracellular cation channel family protein [Verrucomicrobiae bacterium]|nr:trimeric intracellular cation channel family protein [Verrucomicrobiae bacterium]